MQKIHTGDLVQIIRGEDRPQTAEDRSKASGKVIFIDTQNGTCKVEGKNLVTRHRKPKGEGEEGGRIEKEAAIPLSNVMLFNEASGKPERVGFKEVDGRKVRYFKKTGNIVGA